MDLVHGLRVMFASCPHNFIFQSQSKVDKWMPQMLYSRVFFMQFIDRGCEHLVFGKIELNTKLVAIVLWTKCHSRPCNV